MHSISAPDYLNIGQKILQQTKAAYPFGSTNIQKCYPNPNDTLSINPGLIHEVNKSHRALDALLDEPISMTKLRTLNFNRRCVAQYINRTPNDPLKARRRNVRTLISQLSSRSGTGNCEEMSTYAFLQLLKLYPNINTEVMQFVQGDHMFIVINRDPRTVAANWHTWNDTAVIIDPWLGLSFEATDFGKIWTRNCLNIPITAIALKMRFDTNDYLASD